MDFFTANPIASLVGICICFALLYFVYRTITSSLMVILLVCLLTFLGYTYYRDTPSIDVTFKKTKIESRELWQYTKDIFNTAGEKVSDTFKDIKGMVDE